MCAITSRRNHSQEVETGILSRTLKFPFCSIHVTTNLHPRTFNSSYFQCQHFHLGNGGLFFDIDLKLCNKVIKVTLVVRVEFLMLLVQRMII